MKILQYILCIILTQVLKKAYSSWVNNLIVNSKACEDVRYITAPGGTITSPLTPRSPSLNISCTWIINNPTNEPIILSFTEFDLAKDSLCSEDCCNDQWLSIKTLFDSNDKPYEDARENILEFSPENDFFRENDHINMYQAKIHKPKKTLRKNKTQSFNPILENAIHKTNYELDYVFKKFHRKKRKSPNLLLASDNTLYYMLSGSKTESNKNENSADIYGEKQTSILELEHFVTTKHMCGNNVPQPILTLAPKIQIQFVSQDTVDNIGLRGFKLQFKKNLSRSICEENEFSCFHPELCLPIDWKCNGQNECPDGSDEISCKVGCVGIENDQHCDHRWNCPHGEDELGCFGCDADEWTCGEGVGCYKAIHRCDGTINCPNSADELFCGSCGPNATQCSPMSQYCYVPKTDRCDGHLTCPGGEDEVGCDNLCEKDTISCSTGGGCYTLSQRCDGVPQCADVSDELYCVPQLCHPGHGAFLCANSKCTRSAWRCDQVDDCGDSSDEKDCLKNSVIVAAAMGGLICSLLLVIAIGCTCRLYALRLGINSSESFGSDASRNMRLIGSGMDRSSIAPIENLSRLQQHMLQREPPPSYNVAISNPATLFTGCTRLGRARTWHRGRHYTPINRYPPGIPGIHDGVHGVSSAEIRAPAVTQIPSRCPVVNVHSQTYNHDKDSEDDDDKDRHNNQMTLPANVVDEEDDDVPLLSVNGPEDDVLPLPMPNMNFSDTPDYSNRTFYNNLIDVCEPFPSTSSQTLPEQGLSNCGQSSGSSCQDSGHSTYYYTHFPDDSDSQQSNYDNISNCYLDESGLDSNESLVNKSDVDCESIKSDSNDKKSSDADSPMIDTDLHKDVVQSVCDQTSPSIRIINNTMQDESQSDSNSDVAGDFMDATRAAVLALSAVQRHTDGMADTELLLH